jgi:hypothetical protein
LNVVTVGRFKAAKTVPVSGVQLTENPENESSGRVLALEPSLRGQFQEWFTGFLFRAINKFDISVTPSKSVPVALAPMILAPFGHRGI